LVVFIMVTPMQALVWNDDPGDIQISFQVDYFRCKSIYAIIRRL